MLILFKNSLDFYERQAILGAYFDALRICTAHAHSANLRSITELSQLKKKYIYKYASISKSLLIRNGYEFARA